MALQNFSSFLLFNKIEFSHYFSLANHHSLLHPNPILGDTSCITMVRQSTSDQSNTCNAHTESFLLLFQTLVIKTIVRGRSQAGLLFVYSSLVTNLI
jgi:hypothetical protein